MKICCSKVLQELLLSLVKCCRTDRFVISSEAICMTYRIRAGLSLRRDIPDKFLVIFFYVKGLLCLGSIVVRVTGSR